MKNWKGAGVTIQQDGSLSWRNVSYSKTVANGCINTVTHVPTQETVNIATMKLPDSLVVQSNWSDKQAHWEGEGCPSLRLHAHFKGEKGPHSFPAVTGKKSKTEEEANALFQAFQRAKAGLATSSASSGSGAAKALLLQQKKEAQTANVEKATKTRQESVAKRRRLSAATG